MFRERFYISDRTEKANPEVMRLLDKRITPETIAALQALSNNNTNTKFDPDKRMI